MIIREVVVTDSCVAYMSNKFRYTCDIARSWLELRTDKRRLIYMVISGICSMISLEVVTMFSLCLTSKIETEDDWTATSCPGIPQNITEMLRVGVTYQAPGQAKRVYKVISKIDNRV